MNLYKPTKETKIAQGMYPSCDNKKCNWRFNNSNNFDLEGKCYHNESGCKNRINKEAIK